MRILVRERTGLRHSGFRDLRECYLSRTKADAIQPPALRLARKASELLGLATATPALAQVPAQASSAPDTRVPPGYVSGDAGIDPGRSSVEETARTGGRQGQSGGRR
jgi:hypothetical protein